MTAGDRILTTGALALGAALLVFAVSRADPFDAGTLVGLLLVAAAATSLLLGSSLGDRRAGSTALAAGAALITVAVGHGATATIVERDLRIGMLPLALPMVAAVLIRSPRLALVAAAGGVAAGPGRMLVYDPFLDPHCMSCAPGELVLWPAPHLAAALEPIGLLVTIVAVVLALQRGRAAIELQVVLACLVAFGAHVARDQAVLLGAIAAASWLARSTAAEWRRRRAVRRLLRALDDGDDLTTVLRRALADDTLIVAFPDGEAFVDRSGTAVLPAPDQVTAALPVDGTLVARIHHAPATRMPELALGLDAPMRLALGNERLTAQLAARVNELVRARAEVVENGVLERRALERDLHDGVQQDLLALGLDLRVAASGLGPHDPERGRLEDAVVGVHAALDEIRDISHGVYPPLLATRGIAAATASLARRRSAPMGLGAVPEGRFPDAVERAVFAVVAEAVDRGAQNLEVQLAMNRLVVHATGAGPGADGILPDLVAAVGGQIQLGTPEIWAEFPCG